MKKDLIQKVIDERVVDTPKYRYMRVYGKEYNSIYRFPKKYVGTKDEHDKNKWEVVARVRFSDLKNQRDDKNAKHYKLPTNRQLSKCAFK